MRVLIQRVLSASVSIDGRVHSSTGSGLLVLLGVAEDDTRADADRLAAKTAALRIFDDAAGIMNLDVRQAGGELLVVSQFTLLASTRRGNRPSYIRAARGDAAVSLYGYFIDRLSSLSGRPVASGVFGADMQVSLVNDGPVTIWLDSRYPE